MNDKHSRHRGMMVQRQKRVYVVLRRQRVQISGTGTEIGGDGGEVVGVAVEDDVGGGIHDMTGCSDILLGGRSNRIVLGCIRDQPNGMERAHILPETRTMPVRTW